MSSSSSSTTKVIDEATAIHEVLMAKDRLTRARLLLQPSQNPDSLLGMSVVYAAYKDIVAAEAGLKLMADFTEERKRRNHHDDDDGGGGGGDSSLTALMPKLNSLLLEMRHLPVDARPIRAGQWINAIQSTNDSDSDVVQVLRETLVNTGIVMPMEIKHSE